MPRYNVWIKKEHQLLWDAIDNKSEWIAERLDGTSAPVTRIVHGTEELIAPARTPDQRTADNIFSEIVTKQNRIAELAESQDPDDHDRATRLHEELLELKDELRTIEARRAH